MLRSWVGGQKNKGLDNEGIKHLGWTYSRTSCQGRCMREAGEGDTDGTQNRRALMIRDAQSARELPGAVVRSLPPQVCRLGPGGQGCS